MTDYGRRRFIFSIPALLALVGCQGLSGILVPEEESHQRTALKRVTQTVAVFLDARFSTSYTSDPDWAVEGLLLTFLGSWGTGHYKYFVNGQYIAGPINLRIFDPHSDHLRIERMMDNGFWKQVWTYKPRRRTVYIPHEQEMPSPR